MKMIKRLMILLVIVGVLGYSAYHFGMEVIAEKAAEEMTTQLDSEEQLTDIKEAVQTIPEMKAFIEEGKHIDPAHVPFTTKEEAAKVIMKKVGLTELKDIYSEYQQGMSEKEMQQILNDLGNKLTEDELRALKAIAYQELNPE